MSTANDEYSVTGEVLERLEVSEPSRSIRRLAVFNEEYRDRAEIIRDLVLDGCVAISLDGRTSVPFGKNDGAYHREMELLVEAGLKPLEAIAAGTLHNARFFGIEDRLDTLPAGKTADLILIDGDPSKGISVMRKVRHVMLNGN